MTYSKGSIKNTEFFTTADLAEKLKMNVQVITRKVQAGEIEAYKIGKEWRIPEEAVHDWLESHSNKGIPRSKKDKVLATFVKDDKVKSLPVQSSKRKYLLEYILAQFEPNRLYDEEELNRIISRYHDDFCRVRREFVDEKMMDRENGQYRRRSSYRLSG